ncbi:hypothetical protein CN980_09815 [Bacillus cereus]|uniref:Uncharacterized protein n=1 Tax=Bacillus cereus TaxID=1396 RepID=A0A9X7GQL9_BACCE|nr:hypothetical protein [Bacillus cereus]OUB36711.1 hypothetical protein BK708_02285 [Bacillus thuringiensis serovar yunnanensis]PGO78220.1 hypothetical protein CN980_09815 [Bacillus cereus]
MKDKLLMIFISLIALGVAIFAIDVYRDKSELEAKLAKYQSEEQLKKDAEKFTTAVSEGGMAKYLTDDAKKKLQKEVEEHEHSKVVVKDTKIQQVYTSFTNKEKTKAISYATYEATYDIGREDVPSVYKQVITVKGNWILQKGEWKCEKFETILGADSRDEELRQQIHQ